MHPEASGWVEQCVAQLTMIPQVVIELGARNVNGGVRHLFPTAHTYIGVDITPGPGVDVVADAADWNCDVLADVIVSTEMLEHTPHGARIVKQACNNLLDGGVFIVTAAGQGRSPHSAVDGGPLQQGEHYANIDPDVLVDWFAAAGFTTWTVDVQTHPADVRGIATR